MKKEMIYKDILDCDRWIPWVKRNILFPSKIIFFCYISKWMVFYGAILKMKTLVLSGVKASWL